MLSLANTARPYGRSRLNTHRWLFAMLMLGYAVLSLTVHAEAALQVRHYAAFHETRVDASATANDSTQRTRFGIDGRNLTLALQDNSEMFGGAPRSLRHVQMQRGQLEGRPGSWVRLTRSSQGVNGLIWDGQQMYVVAPAATVANATAGSDSVIYKLSDASVELPADYCGSDTATTGSSTGLQAYAAVVNELASATGSTSSTAEASLRLEMQVLADASYRAEYNSDEDALAALMTRLNNVDGIFRSQLGLTVQATNVQFLSSDNSSLTSSTDASTLLSSLAQLRGNSAVMGTYPVTHLVTGRDLDGDTLGISYIGQICGARYGVSLSEVRSRGVWIDSLVMAHEIGHQLGAVHDGTGTCSGADSQAYLMSATINGNSDFSACSKQTILSTMASSACLVSATLPLQTSTVTDAGTASAASKSGGGTLNQLGLVCLLFLLALRSRLSSMPHPATAPNKK